MPDIYLVTPATLRWYMRGMHRRFQGRPAPFSATWFVRMLPEIEAAESRTVYDHAVAESEGWDYADKLLRLARYETTGAHAPA